MNTREMTREIREQFAGSPYTCYHAPRFATLLSLVAGLARPGDRILDIGRSELTTLLHRKIGAPVDSLGFQADQTTETGRHFQFDLNHSQHDGQWRRDVPTYPVVVMAEVIEHLYTSPRLVLSFLRTLVEPGGALVVQTPNALALMRRLKPLLGIHPYERIREDITNPGHFREYTGPELREYAAGAGFDVAHLGYYNYFDFRFSAHTGATTPRWIEAIKFRFHDFVPGTLKPGITAILRRPT